MKIWWDGKSQNSKSWKPERGVEWVGKVTRNGREIYRINFLGTSMYEKWKLTPHITFVMMIKSEFRIYSNSVSALFFLYLGRPGNTRQFLRSSFSVGNRKVLHPPSPALIDAQIKCWEFCPHITAFQVLAHMKRIWIQRYFVEKISIYPAVVK